MVLGPQDLGRSPALRDLFDELADVAVLPEERIFVRFNPHSAPVINPALGCYGAAAKTNSNVGPAARRPASASSPTPSKQEMTLSSSAFVLPFFSTFTS